ncbi:ectoine/hydroxyectoine ABC transporter substrate-binding protein EhuB [Naumannella halotolerans]|uniref:Polar amino acid transport system substrate-binding protein n=1 Tax=Naumannella halotolerans TaxID=993414 RepID=A0A4R7J5I4_9ACTN|nr:ectoine/hydroxyectoine ABC transporter substrate-binding protein EhuB [Naumannella halotolerans]TDT32612.1 polar amino acid transport system substrate-binding protein [Naumannella halotolerans]
MPFILNRRSLFVAGLGAAGAGLLGACTTTTPGAPGGQASANLLETARQQGYLRVAIANEPPYTQVETDGTVTGCEPDILRAVAQRLGIDDIQGIVTPYESMIPGLQANRWDVIAAGLFMKQSRCAEVSYSEPVIVSTESFAVPSGNPGKITTIADVLANPELKVGVIPGGFEEGILNSAAVPAEQQVQVDDGRSGVEALQAGRCDVFLLPTLSLEALIEDGDEFEVTDPIPDAPATGSGAAFRQSDQSFVDAYNTELTAFKATDEFTRIQEQWGFDPAAVEGVTAEQLCQNEG